MNTLPQQTNATETPELPELSGETVSTNSPAAVKNPIDNVPVKIAAVLGKMKIDLAHLKSLDDGAVVELDRKVGEPIDLYVNDRLIARGELVMVDGSLGVTMTEIVREDDI